MKTQKPKRSKWFSFVVGGIAFMVLACSGAEARQFVADYQANPSGYVVAVNPQTNKMMLIKNINAAAQKERLQLMKSHHLKTENIGTTHTIKAKIIKTGGVLMLEMKLFKHGQEVDSVSAPLSTAKSSTACTKSHKGACPNGSKCITATPKKCTPVTLEGSPTEFCPYTCMPN